MTLMLRRTPRSELAWPSWFANTPLVDWPSWSVVGGEPEIKVEELMDDGQLVVRAELPGIDPEHDVEITVADRMLTIRAERRHEERTDEADGFRSEFRYGSFTRSMMLPVGASDADVTASYHDGILEVRVPVATNPEARKVTVARS
jgi:HSP20 family protein